jgi:glycerol-3-phosphate dehydrogenase
MNTQGIAPWKVSREHFIKESDSGLISVVGGKYTTYRRLAQQLVDIVTRKFEGRVFKPCETAEKWPSPAQKAGEGDLRSLVERAVKEEMSVSLTDLIFRRLQLAYTPSRGFDAIDECAMIMSELLGWSPAQKEAEIKACREALEKNIACLR